MTTRPRRRKWALITGVSPSGLGSALTQELLRRSINVIATTPDASLQPLAHLSSPTPTYTKLATLHLDVTSAPSISTAVSQTSEFTGGRLDYLFNNAGYGYMSPLLSADLDAVRRNFEVNVFGLLAVTQAFFPLLREARGVVVCAGSIAGLSGCYQPFIGSYSASKAAVGKVGDTLRVELAPFGVKVVTLVTGDVRTQFWENARAASPRLAPDSPYEPIRAKAEAMMAGKTNPAGQHEAERWAKEVLNQVLAPSPPGHVRKGFLAWAMWIVSLLLPYWLLDWLYARTSGLGELRGHVIKARSVKKTQ
ncbi:hypothetical protein BAUCODRAFT_398672 [Baudoinia panamericana UAMH 10762]|uniref:NAD(P)-binding protein n=1 Tax=Baudoinia panamericana (strain UAMH 10762) TaxID=717646 RepID=M2NIS8_BAUPA|nr:uncharacterized protein BAUCODRAFT_398672 [Baudoinia panamericana UAMH 10762]EMC99299.1 hypothetical protein BAUCODRAFT_398672 [Baudoinia panamericana UAMH 10762]